jgi:flagellar assembly factor FliW
MNRSMAPSYKKNLHLGLFFSKKKAANPINPLNTSMKKLLLVSFSILTACVLPAFAQESDDTSNKSANTMEVKHIQRFTLIDGNESQTFDVFAKENEILWIAQDVADPESAFTLIDAKILNEPIPLDVLPQDFEKFKFTNENYQALILIKVEEDGKLIQAHVRCPLVINKETGLGKKVCNRSWKPLTFQPPSAAKNAPAASGEEQCSVEDQDAATAEMPAPDTCSALINETVSSSSQDEATVEAKESYTHLEL